MAEALDAQENIEALESNEILELSGGVVDLENVLITLKQGGLASLKKALGKN